MHCPQISLKVVRTMNPDKVSDCSCSALTEFAQHCRHHSTGDLFAVLLSGPGIAVEFQRQYRWGFVESVHLQATSEW